MKENNTAVKEVVDQVPEVKETKSQKIREMYKEGKSISEIARILNINYSFAYQTVRRYCEQTGKDFITSKNRNTKSQKIREMYQSGMSIAQISKELQTNYNYVWMVVNKMKRDLTENC